MLDHHFFPDLVEVNDDINHFNACWTLYFVNVYCFQCSIVIELSQESDFDFVFIFILIT
jgi:hypothetical protein